MHRTLYEIKHSRSFTIFLIIIAVTIIFSLVNPFFFSTDNLESLLFSIQSTGIIAIGMMVVMVGNGVDLSAGSTLALCGVVLAKTLETGLPIWAGVFTALILGAAIGLLNGAIITIIGINPFITTLGTMSMIRGIGLSITESRPIYDLPNSFALLSDSRLLGVHTTILILIVLTVAIDQFMRRVSLGRYLYFIGGDLNASKLAGMNVNFIRICSYVLSGITAAIASIIMTSRMMSMTATAGNGIELKAISACIIGGASLAGGKGTVIGGLLGTLLVGLIDNILVLSDVSTYWQLFSSGFILLFVMISDIIISRGQPI